MTYCKSKGDIKRHYKGGTVFGKTLVKTEKVQQLSFWTSIQWMPRNKKVDNRLIQMLTKPIFFGYPCFISPFIFSHWCIVKTQCFNNVKRTNSITNYKTKL